MSENETMLINLIREHKNPEKALVTAVEVIVSYLTTANVLEILKNDNCSQMFEVLVRNNH